MTAQVTIKKSGNSFTVNDGETVLEAALRTGHMLPYSCRSGTCGTCKARILSGDIDYGDYTGDVLTDTDRRQGIALLCQAHPQSDLLVDAREVEVNEEIEIKLLPCRVLRLEPLSHDVMGVHLKLPQHQNFNYLAGQYIDILLRDGRRRSFSIANAPSDERELELHVRRVPDGHFTNHIFTQTKERDIMRFQGPLGTFFLRPDSDREVLLVAGGTGFAPIKAIVEHALEHGITRPMHLFWGVRSERDLYMSELAAGWAREHEHFNFVPVLSEPESDVWSGRTGFVHAAVLAQFPDLTGFEVYAAGPPPMIDAIQTSFFDAGLDPENLFFDSFDFGMDVPLDV